MVVGKPISVGDPISPNAPEFEKRVEEIHKKVQSELERLYNDNKNKFGWSSRPLEIF